MPVQFGKITVLGCSALPLEGKSRVILNMQLSGWDRFRVAFPTGHGNFYLHLEPNDRLSVVTRHSAAEFSPTHSDPLRAEELRPLVAAMRKRHHPTLWHQLKTSFDRVQLSGAFPKITFSPDCKPANLEHFPHAFERITKVVEAAPSASSRLFTIRNLLTQAYKQARQWKIFSH